MSNSNVKEFVATNQKQARDALTVLAGTAGGDENRNAWLERVGMACRAAADVAKGKKQLNQKLEGAYTTLTNAAHELGAESFDKMVTSIETMIGRNQRIEGNNEGLGWADVVGAELNKKGDAYNVPGSFSNAKSVIVYNLKNGLPLMTDEGEPKSFSELRKARTVHLEQVRRANAPTPVRQYIVAGDVLAHVANVLSGASTQKDASDQIEGAMGDSAQRLADHLTAWYAEHLAICGDAPEIVSNKLKAVQGLRELIDGHGTTQQVEVPDAAVNA